MTEILNLQALRGVVGSTNGNFTMRKGTQI